MQTNESQCLQLLGSDPEQSHLLQYCASDEKWSEYLIGSGLIDPKAKPSAQGSHKLSTAGGPDDFKGHHGRGIQKGSDSQKYAIISIMGPQSSGKSTILNKLFGTRFDVMDHTRGRHQVTTGIWIGSCPKARDLMVLDLEGTDSAERKQNRSNFERQTSLMALTLSEVLIINMWASDIGRSTGMNVDTLRAILEANLRLFAPNSKTLLLFLIREQCPDETQFGVTPAAELRSSIQRVVLDIWNSIDKPDNFGTTQISDLFDIDFFFMPPLVYFRKEFDAKVTELYARFTSPSDPNYYFSKPWHFSKCVPPEGLSTWTRQIFGAITKDESLNIPDQQKLLSAYRCEHALNEAFAVFTQKTADVASAVKERFVEGFGSKLDAVIAECMAMYKATASKYDAEEAAEKYAALVDKCETQIQFMFAFQYKHLEAAVMQRFEAQMSAALPNANSGKCVEDLNAVVGAVGESVRKFFSEKMKECMIDTDNKQFLDAERFWKETQERLREQTKMVQAEQWRLLQTEMEALADEHLLAHIGKLLRAPTQRLWSKVSLLRVKFVAEVVNPIVMAKLAKLMYDGATLKERQSEMRSASDELIVNRCKRHCKRIDAVLKDVFAAHFAKDPRTGIPRTWDETVKLDEVFTTAKREAETVLEVSQQITLDADRALGLPEISLKLLGVETVEEVRADFNRYADGEFRRAEALIRNAGLIGGGILPTHPVTWAVFLFFAKDEIWSMLTNPLYLITFVLGAAILVIGYQAHVYGFDVQTIVMQMVQKTVGLVLGKLEEFQRKQMEIQRRGQTRGRQTMNPPMPGRQNPTDDGSDDEDTAGR